ncbi:MAG: hypothetical protein WD063_17565 [Pirellulales bacterium]
MSKDHTTPKLTVFEDFLNALSTCFKEKPQLIQMTMSNVFSMRMIGNKTHGDLAEVALAEFITKYVEGHTARHVGKDLFRAKSVEQDISVLTPTGEEIPISLKAYGVGPLQLSTNKDSSMFTILEETLGKGGTTDRKIIESLLLSGAFADFHKVNVLPLIYNEKKMICNILVYEVRRAFDAARKIDYLSSGKGRKHPIYRFTTIDGQYIFEVRYGGVSANALQRGLWTHTVNAAPFFRSLTDWITYTINKPLLDVIARVLVSTQEKHEQILKML